MQKIFQKIKKALKNFSKKIYEQNILHRNFPVVNSGTI